MADGRTVGWETCAEQGCVGVQLPSGGRCWAHADGHDLDAALERLSEGDDLDGRGVAFTAALLGRVLDAVPNDDGRAVVTDAMFDRATIEGFTDFGVAKFQGDATFAGAKFEGDVTFEGATLEGYADFEGTTFEGDVTFEGATLEGYADFEGTTFGGEARFVEAAFKGDTTYAGAAFEGAGDFDGATFAGDVGFARATFTGDANFAAATFTGDAGFHTATFTGDARFSEATFTGEAGFDGATFAHDAVFGGVAFERGAWFPGAIFKGDLGFAGGAFERARQLGPMVVRRRLVLDGALFRERIRIEVSAAVLSCQRARFPAGVQLRARWAEVVLDDADLAAPSVLSGANPFPDLDEGDWPPSPASAESVNRAGTPRLLSLRGADVAGLTVADVDLRACQFLGAHHLDHIRIEESDFAYTPTSWQLTTRQTVAEEHHWRADHGSSARDAIGHPSGGRHSQAGWYQPVHRPPDWLGSAKPPAAAQIAALYRDLRKGREDNKDEPGAADFYYGEMEMRRHAKRQQIRLERRRGHWGTAGAAGTEYAILWLYWLVSGYGLRAWRALASLAAVVLVAAVIFAFWGFDQTAGWDELPGALLFSTQSTTALLRGPDPRVLTTVGEWLLIALRLIGPVLLGLAVLSVRGRVKR